MSSENNMLALLLRVFGVNPNNIDYGFDTNAILEGYTDFNIRHAINIIKADYGVDVSVNRKRKNLLKYGSSTQVQTTATTLMTLPSGTFNETYATSNSITHFASATDSDTQQLVVEGHTVDWNGDFYFVTQTVTLQGRTKTALTTPLARCTRAYNNGTTNLAGPVYFAEDVTFTAGVPQTASAVHLMIETAKNQSQKASTTISKVDYWIVTGFKGTLLTKANTAFVNIELQIRRKGKVFREQEEISCIAGGTSNFDFNPYLIVPANSDVRLLATADTNGRSASGSIQGYLATVI